jgi:deoxyribodipyrimidine photo-lyase
MKINIFWFRRDLRLRENTALDQALRSGLPVLPVFIFDSDIIDELQADDPRISFIYKCLFSINSDLEKAGSNLHIYSGDPVKIWNDLLASFDINSVFINKDYEPYSIERDLRTESLLKEHGVILKRYKDQVIFEENEVMKSDNSPYTVFTPYKNRWMKNLYENPPVNVFGREKNQNYYPSRIRFPSLAELGFSESIVKVRPYNLSVIKDYDKYRDFPAADRTSYLSPHLRFGTVSIRSIVDIALQENQVFLGELIWREFFMQILYHFPDVVTQNFRRKYDSIKWINNEDDFKRWCNGETGYPFVDAGMRQLHKTGFMHNRVRMITAGFLCKHLLIDWRWGEAFFAEKLLDYELSSNNGNWQWAAGTGCDAAPYFRIFNPSEQQKKFDPQKEYIRKWVEEINKPSYPEPMIEHVFARERALMAYKQFLI